MITIDERAPLFELTIDRPKANALDASASREMGKAFERFRDTGELRVAIVTGAGDRFFSAGWDLKAASEGEAFDADFGVGGFGGFPELKGLRKPVIAAVNGVAAGGGFEMVLAADLVVAAEHAQFSLPEAHVGLIADAGSIRLPRLLPGPLAKELLLTGRRLPADEAKEWGLVNRVVPSGEALHGARELAGVIADSAPLAVEATLQVIRRTTHLKVDDAFELLRSGQLDAYERMLGSDDAQEGPRAFVEGRDPTWKGR